jgi:hypothetical protein
MFQLDFRDDRYLPFEGAGAISTWRLTMPTSTNAFDFKSVTDVILKVQYTARDGGDTLRSLAVGANPKPPATSLVRMFDARRDFPNDWYAFGHPADASATTFTLQLSVDSDRFPYLYRHRIGSAAHVVVAVKPAEGASAADLVDGVIQVTPPGAAGATGFTLLAATPQTPLPFAEHDVASPAFGAWTLSTTLDPAKIDDIFVFIRYVVT